MSACAAAMFALLVLAACGSSNSPGSAPSVWNGPKTYFEERPAGSEKWTPIDAEPAWVKSPPPVAGSLRFVVDGASDFRSIAAGGRRPVGDHDLAKRVQAALGPLLGVDEASRVADAAKSKLALVSRACSEEDGPNPGVPGSHFVQAWALWEVPIDDVVAAVPAEKRDVARAALAASR